jgi:hypothetical protein
VVQGAIEIEEVNWNDTTGTLMGISRGPIGTSHSVFVYLPEAHPWTWGGSAAFHDFDAYSVRLVDEHIARVHVRFDKVDRVPWEIKPDELFKS